MREDRGYSQEYIAAELGITQSAYAKIESGNSKLGLDRAIAIAALLQTSLTELIPDDATDIAVENNSFADQSSVIQNYYAKNTELYDLIIQDLKEEVRFLRAQLSAINGVKENPGSSTGEDTDR